MSDMEKESKGITETGEEKEPNPVAEKLYPKLLERLKERRNPELFGLFRYLETGAGYRNVVKHSKLNYPKHSELAHIAAKLYDRLFPKESNENQISEQVQSNSGESAPKKSRIEEANELMNMDELNTDKVPETLTLIRKEMGNFESNPREPQPMLKKLKTALLSCVPTSAEPERCFSCCGQFVTKFRTNLQDDTLDAMVLCRCYLKEQENEIKS